MTGIQNKLLTGTIVVMHSEKEAFVVKNTGNTKENLEKRSEVAPLDGNPYGLKLLTRLRLGLSHMRYHKFRHNFLDCINTMGLWPRNRNYNPFPPSLPPFSIPLN